MPLDFLLKKCCPKYHLVFLASEVAIGDARDGSFVILSEWLEPAVFKGPSGFSLPSRV